MSNFLAIATVTAALSEILLAAVRPDVGSADVTSLRPDSNGALPVTGVNVFLYQVTPNAAWRNADLPTRRANGDLVQHSQAALDLHYLLTFYGDDAELAPQRLLGSAVRALHSQPVLTRDLIRKTIAKPAFQSFLANSNLADAIELVKFTPLPLSLEELSKLWSVYFQTQYRLSVAYQATVVLIESEDSTHAALPVSARNIYVAPFRQPFIEKVKAQAGDDAFITSASTVVVTGKRFSSEMTKVSVGGVEVTPAREDVSDTQIILPLNLLSGLRAGVRGLQVIQPRMMGTPLAEHSGVQSNLAAFVLHPTISNITKTVSGEIEVTLDPKVTQTQRVTLLLNEFNLNPPDDRPARAYSFDSVPHNRPEDPSTHRPADPPETDTLTFLIAGVAAGDYLVRVQVDGAESPLEQDPHDNYPAYVRPKVTIP